MAKILTPLMPSARNFYTKLKKFKQTHPHKYLALKTLAINAVILTVIVSLVSSYLLFFAATEPIKKQDELISQLLKQKRLELTLDKANISELAVLEPITLNSNLDQFEAEALRTGITITPAVDYTLAFNEEAKTIELKPLRRWEFQQTYHVEIKAGVYGNTILENPINFDFTTSAKQYSRQNTLVWIDSFYNEKHEFPYYLEDEETSKLKFKLYSSDWNTLKGVLNKAAKSEENYLANLNGKKPISSWEQAVNKDSGTPLIVDIPAEETGIYILETFDNENERLSQNFIFINKFVIAGKVDKNTLHIYAADLKNSKLISDVKLQYFETNTEKGLIKVADQTISGIDKSSGDVAKRTGLVIAEKDGEYAIMNTQTTFFSERIYWTSFIEQSDLTFTYFDKPLYKPSEKLRFKTVIRKRVDGVYRLPDTNASYKVSIKTYVGNSQELEIASLNLKPNAFGNIVGEFDLSQIYSSNGYEYYSLYINDQYDSYLPVQNYTKAQYRTTINFNKDSYTFADKVDLSFSSKTYAGNPLNSGTINLASRYTTGQQMTCEKYSTSGQEHETLSETTLKIDASGSSKASFSINHEKAIYAGNIYVEAKVVGGLGQSVYYNQSAKYYPANYLILGGDKNYSYLVNQPVEFELVKFNKNCERVANKTKITVQGTRTEYIKKAVDDSRKYIYEKVEEPVGPFTIEADANNVFRFKQTFTKKGHYDLTAISNDETNKKTGYALNFTITDESGMYTDEVEDKDFTLLTNKDIYKPGEEVHLEITTKGVRGTGWLVLAGDTVTQSIPVEFTEDTFTLTVPYSEQLLPNAKVYLSIFAKDKYLQEIADISYDVENKNISVDIKTERELYKPGEEVTLNIATALKGSGKGVPSEVSIAVVDKRLLDVSDRHTGTDIFENFWSERHIFVEAYNSLEFSLFIDAGGRGDGGNGDANARDEFSDNPVWLPAVQTDSLGRASTKFKLPDNLTTWAIIVVANNKNNEFGAGEKTIKANLPLAIETNFPEIISDQDEPSLLAFISNNTGAEQDIAMDLAADGLNVITDKKVQQKIPAYSTKTFRWDLRPGAVLRDANNPAKLTVSGGSAQFKDAVAMKTQILPLGYKKLQSYSKEKSFGESYQLESPSLATGKVIIYPSYQAFVAPSLNTMNQNFGSDSALDAANRLFSNSFALKNYGKYGTKLNMSENQLRRSVKLDQLYLYRTQRENGGWNFWSEYSGYDQAQANDNVTPYILLALRESNDIIAVPESVLNLARGYVKGRLSALKGSSQLSPELLDRYVFLQYGLSFYEKVPAAYTDEALANPSLSHSDQALLAVVANNSGNSAKAYEILNSLLKKANNNSGVISWTDNRHPLFPEFKNYQSSYLPTALTLRAMVRIDAGAYKDKISASAKYILKTENAGLSSDPIATINTLEAFNTIADKNFSGALGYTIAQNGQTLKTGQLLNTDSALTIALKGFSQSNSLNVAFSQNVDVYSDVVIVDTVKTRPVTTVKVEKKIFNASAQQTNKLGLGEFAVVSLRIVAGENYAYQPMRMEDGLAGGTEITLSGVDYNSLPGYIGSFGEFEHPQKSLFGNYATMTSYPYTYIAGGPAQMPTKYYVVATTNPGKYKLNPTFAQGVYLPGESANSAIVDLEIVE